MNGNGRDIRRLGSESVAAVLELWRRAELFYRPEGRDAPDRLARELETTSSFLLGAFEGDQLVGVALGTDDGRKGWINRVAVLSEHRRSGVARALIQACEAAFQERGIGILACLIEDGNDASLELFASEGYEVRRDIVYLRKPAAGRDW